MDDCSARVRFAESKKVAEADTSAGGGTALLRELMDSTVPLGKLKTLAGEGAPKGDTADTCSWAAIDVISVETRLVVALRGF